MKSYGYLWEQFISDENIELALRNMRKGKLNRNSIERLLAKKDVIGYMRNYAENYHNDKHIPRTIYDGVQRKKRTIVVPTPREQTIHHMVVNILKPIFLKGMYEHSYGSVPGGGGFNGAKATQKWIRRGENTQYCLKMDIKKYFNSIPHNILLRKLRKIMRDDRFYSILEEIISVTDVGIPLGFYTSQWLANWYLQGLDHFIKEELGAVYYIRYMDDMVIFDSDKEKLHNMRREIERYMVNELGLEMKPNWQVFLFNCETDNEKSAGRFLDFMGFRFYSNRVTLRKSIMIRATRKAIKLWSSDKPSIFEVRQMLSYLGWIKHTNTYKMYKDRIKPYVDFGYCEKRISQFDRRNNRKEVITCGTQRKIQAA